MKCRAILCCLWTTGIVYALDPTLHVSQYQKRNWQVEDGLPHNYVMAVMPGPGRFLLVATDEGLARFDGVRFVPEDLDPSLGLSKRWVLTMMTARDGSLWIGTFDGGLYQWRADRVITRLDHGASVFAILEDSTGRIWASTRSGVIRSHSGGSGFLAVSGLVLPSDTSWNVLAKDLSGGVWVVTSDGLYCCRGDTCVRKASSRGSTGQILAVHVDARGTVHIGTSRGLYRTTPQDATSRLAQTPGIPGPVVSLLDDRNGNLWAGTWGKGLYRVGGTGVEAWTSRQGLPDDFIRTLYGDAEGNLWIGVRGGGLSRWKNASLIPVGIPEGMTGDFATTVASDAQGELWLGTWRGGLYRLDPDGSLRSQPTPVPVLFYTIRAMAIDGHGAIWTGNWEGLSRYDGHRFTHFAGVDSNYHHVSTILFDRRGRLWIGTSDHGLFQFSGDEPTDSPAAHWLDRREITSLEEDRQGNVWVGTSSGAGWIDSGRAAFHAAVGVGNQSVAGLSIDSKQRIWACTLGGALWQLSPSGTRVIDGRNGLPPHPLYRALDDGIGGMWVSSPRGVLRIPMEQLERAAAGGGEKVDVAVFDQDDGMRTIECHRLSQPAGGRARNGDLWFPTTKGFVRIRPSTLSPVAPPEPIFETSTQEVRFQPGTHDLQIPFTALRFSSPEKIQFRYRMEGFDPDWIPAAGARSARYNRLPAGKFRLLVSARLPGGPWSPPASIAVVQMPRFDQTGWFLFLLLLASIGAATAVYRWRMLILRRRYSAVIAERNRIAREWHDTLVAGFSAISLQIEAAMFRLGDQAAPVGEMLEVTRRIVHHYRAEARRVIWDLRDNRPDSESLVDALTGAMHLATDGKGIDGTVSVSGQPVRAPREVEHNLLRICQEALANAVRHGHPSQIRLDVCYAPKELAVRIQDNGRGFEQQDNVGLDGGHFGLTVMQERARRFGGRFELTSQRGQGTVVEAAIPIASGNGRPQ